MNKIIIRRNISIAPVSRRRNIAKGKTIGFVPTHYGKLVTNIAPVVAGSPYPKPGKITRHPKGFIFCGVNDSLIQGNRGSTYKLTYHFN